MLGHDRLEEKYLSLVARGYDKGFLWGVQYASRSVWLSSKRLVEVIHRISWPFVKQNGCYLRESI